MRLKALPARGAPAIIGRLGHAARRSKISSVSNGRARAAVRRPHDWRSAIRDSDPGETSRKAAPL